MKFKIIFFIVASLLLFSVSFSAFADNTATKPTITKSMCAKLWYGCQRYDMAKALFYQSMGANSIIENDRMLERMKNGDTEIAEKFIRVIQRLYGRDVSWANFKLFDFTHSELEVSNELYSYYANQAKSLRKQEQENQYAEWSINGVPANVEPSNKPKLVCCNKDSVIAYLNRNPELFTEDAIKIRVVVDANGSIALANGNDRIASMVFPHLCLKVKEPAYVTFDEIDKILPLKSVITVTLDFDLHNIASRFYRSDFEASTKYDKKKEAWNVKITKDYLDKFMEATGGDTEIYLNCIGEALSQLEEKPHKYITVKIYNVTFDLTYQGDKVHGVGNYSLISDCKLNPIAEILGSQSAFSRMINN